MFDVTIESSLDKFQRLFKEALEKASKQAVKATANDAIKVTLPNNLNNVDKSKPASKQKGTFAKNIKALKTRIKQDIIGDGIEGKGIPTAIPAANGEPIPNSIKGIAYMPYFLVAKPKGSKRRFKLGKTKAKVANSPQELIQFLKKTTHLKSKKVTYRHRNSASVIWITKASVAKQAAGELQKRAGKLLSGWTQLANKAAEKEDNILNGLLNGQTVDRTGSAKIRIGKGKVSILAYNDEVPEFKSRYQQNVVDSTLPKSFQYHLQNAINNINFNTLKNQAKK